MYYLSPTQTGLTDGQKRLILEALNTQGFPIFVKHASKQKMVRALAEAGFVKWEHCKTGSGMKIDLTVKITVVKSFRYGQEVTVSPVIESK